MKVFLLLFYAVTDLNLFFFVQSPTPQIFVRILNHHVAKQNKSHEVRNSHEGIKYVSHCPNGVEVDYRTHKHGSRAFARRSTSFWMLSV